MGTFNIAAFYFNKNRPKHPTKWTNKLALCVVSHATQTLSLPPSDYKSTWTRLIIQMNVFNNVALFQQ